MTNRALLLLAVLVAFFAGGLSGFFARRAPERINLPSPRRRPAALRDALEAHESGHPALRWVGDADGATHPPLDLGFPEDQAEAMLVAMLADSDLHDLEAVAKRWPGTHAAARALWETIGRTTDERRLTALRATFDRRHPDAWVLRKETR